MDWLPNVDGVQWFVRDVLPLVRRKLPECSLTIVGRTPPPAITGMAEKDPLIEVTGTVADIRPYLWRSAVSIVPLRIGGGTRLKIYESMAGRTAVVSTTVGAEGLAVHPGGDIRIADSPEAFAAHCEELLRDRAARERQAAAAWELVAQNFSWGHVAACFEAILQTAPQYC
jgi:glycosyltransferase involved in cell wall biosynthesis